MKILLVFPTQLNENGAPIRYQKAFLPPLSLAILNRLTPDYHEVKVINDVVEPVDYRGGYDLIGITALTAQAPRAYQIADKFRSQGKKVIIGGVHASMLPHEAGRHADSVLVGEAEDLWEQILVDYENKRSRPIYGDHQFPSLEKLIVPKWDGFNLSIYRPSIGNRKRPRMPIFTTEGAFIIANIARFQSFLAGPTASNPLQTSCMKSKRPARKAIFSSTIISSVSRIMPRNYS